AENITIAQTKPAIYELQERSFLRTQGGYLSTVHYCTENKGTPTRNPGRHHSIYHIERWVYRVQETTKISSLFF
ncbi:MAG: hypothetical protein PHG36_10895, partial [Dehalococcoidia bacterium]|nr:hypothetical protein [Dehalococcoidia bacterium]